MANEIKKINISDLMPFRYAYNHVLPRIDSHLDSIDELVNLLRTNKYRTLMANPKKPTTFESNKKRSREDKERLYAGNHEFKDNIILSSEELIEIVGPQNSHHAATLENYITSDYNGMSGELDLNEIECLRYWIVAKKELEDIEDIPYHDYPRPKDICYRAKELYRFEQICELNVLLTLLKKRNDYYNDFITKEDQYDLEYRIQERIITKTNVLIKESIFIQIIENIKIGASFIPKYFKEHANEQLQVLLEAKYNHCLILLKILVRCIFRITTNTQLNYNEAKNLREMIHDFSASIVDNNKGSTFSDDEIESGMIKPYGFFVMLQLSMVNAWKQDEKFFLRDLNKHPFRSEDDDYDNELNQYIEKMDHKTENSEKGKENLLFEWKCNGVRGFLSLIFATVINTKCEYDDYEVKDMFWFFNTARISRAYTYIRLCILPVLQTNYDFDGDEIELCSLALSYLLEKILAIGVIWRKQYQVDEYDTHFLVYDLNERQDYPNYDYIDDVLQTFASFSTVFPTFVNSLWDDLNKLQDENRSVCLHVFLLINVDACYWQCTDECHLDKQLSILHLLISAASGTNDRASLAMYRFLDKHTNPHDKNRPAGFDQQNSRETSLLDDLFERLSDTAKMFGMVEDFKYSTKVAKPLTWSDDQDAVVSSSNSINNRRLLILIATADLLTAIFQNQIVFEKLMESGRYQDPINVIFSLIVCPVKIDLKGALFRCLAAIAFHSEENARRIWEILETHQVLPSVLRDEGVRFELKSELNSGRYPCTEGFLDLLSSLLSHGVPNDLGEGYRWPGITPYLEFVVDDIILSNRRGRHYEPEGPLGSAQRWRLTSRALKVLSIVLQHYNINNLRFEDQSNSKVELAVDFRDESGEYEIRRDNGNIEKITCSKPKSAGFVVMSLLLGNFRLMEAIITLLREGNFDAIEQSRTNMIQHMNELALSRFHYLIKSSIQHRYKLQKSKVILSQSNLLDGSCDEAYWMEKTTTMCIGILYECSLREDIFLQCFRTGNKNGLKIKRTEGGRPCFVPVIIHGGLSSILAVDLHILCGLLQLQSKNVFCIPKMPVMAARILQHISLSMTVEDFLSGAQRIQSFENLRIGLSDLLISVYEEDNISKYGLPLGGEFSIDMFTMSMGATRPLRLKYFVSSDSDDLQTLETLKVQPIKDAIINLLLSTLSRNHDCLSHYLLGVSEFDFHDTDKAQYCLKAILSLLNRPNVNEHMLLNYPARACLCFELLHSLCTSTRKISEKVLHILRNSKGQCSIEILKQLSYCYEIMLQKDNDNISNEIKSATYNCCAWILQICALEFRTLSHDKSAPQEIKLLTGLLQAQEKISNPITLVGILKFAFEEAPDIHRCEKKYPDMWNALRDSQTQLNGEEECVKIDQDTLNYLLRKAVHKVLEERFPKDEVYAEFENITRVAEEVNEANNFLSASFHLCRAWNQVVSIALDSCLELCLKVLVTAQNNIDDYMYSNMTRLTETLIIPTLKELECSQSLVSSERIIPAVLVMMNAINKSKTRLKDDQDPISTAQLLQILNSLISLILQQTAGKEESSRYKGFLYVCLIEILNIVPKSIDSSADLQVKNCISQKAKELMEPLVFDALKSPTIWRLSALSLMTMIINICSDFSDSSVSNVPGHLIDFNYHQDSSIFDIHSIIVNDLLKSGNLSNILDGMGPIHSPISDGIFDFYDNIDEDILQNTLAFCVQVASTVNGVDALITCGIMSRINNFPHLNDSVGILNPAVENISDVIKIFETFLETKFMPVLSILKAMIITSSSSQVIYGAAMYILHNHLVFSYLLRLKLKSLRGLEMTEAAVSFLNLVVGGTESGIGHLRHLQKDVKLGPPESSSTLLTWDLVLGNRSDNIITSICELLKKIGARDPYPLKMTRHNRQDTYSAWWSQIQPTTEQEVNDCKERYKRRKMDDDIFDVSNELTVFDAKKRSLGLDILRSAATFLRIRTSSIQKETNENGGNNIATMTSADYLSIDYDIISEVFCKCSSICRKRQNDILMSNNVINDDDGSTKVLEIISENMIFVIYHLVQSTPSRSRESSKFSATTENCIRHGEDWPPETLVNQVTRWIKDIIYNSNKHMIGR